MKRFAKIVVKNFCLALITYIFLRVINFDSGNEGLMPNIIILFGMVTILQLFGKDITDKNFLITPQQMTEIEFMQNQKKLAITSLLLLSVLLLANILFFVKSRPDLGDQLIKLNIIFGFLLLMFVGGLVASTSARLKQRRND